MKSYALLSDDGFVISTTYSSIEQEGMVELTEPIGDKPSEWHKYHLETKEWVEFKVAEPLTFEVKNKRKELLSDSDWTQLPNSPLTTEQQEAWAVYRQELRDIPQQSGYPFNVVFPTPP